MPLQQLIYVSSAVEVLPDEELDRILESSVRHNTPQQVTGMLLYSGGNFMQVLEGEAAALDETYDRICHDPRHRNIVLLYREVISSRSFMRWSMGFHRVTPKDAETHPAYAHLFSDGFDAQAIGAESGLAAALLLQFCEPER